MIILGIDPGSIKVGFAIVDVSPKLRRPKILELGTWELLRAIHGERKMQREASLGERLENLAVHLKDLLEEWNPSVIGLEKAVHYKNAASAQTLSEARGVIRLLLHQNLESADKRLIELSPTMVKKVASGAGSASKEGVLKSMKLRFPELQEMMQNSDFHFDAFDALAIALTAWNLSQKTQRIAQIDHRS